MPPFASVLLVNLLLLIKPRRRKPGPLLCADHTAALVSGGLRLKAADRRFLRQENKGGMLTEAKQFPTRARQLVKKLPANKATHLLNFMEVYHLSNFKKLLSMLLAIVMICSTFAIGAEAAYSEYKDGNIKSYDAIDQPVFTAAQLSSIALDAVDAMLAEIDEPYFKIPVINVTIRFSSIDAALNSLEGVYNGSAWATVTNIAGDLGNLEFKALNSTASSNFSAEGVRRTTAGKTDLDVIYSLFQFLYDNRELLASYGYGTLDLGATLTGLIEGMLPEFGAYLDAPNLLKGLIYDIVYDPDDKNGLPEWDELSDTEKAQDKYKADNMAQLLVDDLMVDLEESLAKDFDWGIKMNLSDVLDLDAPSFYDVFEEALQRAYAEILVPLGNTQFKKVFYEILGVKDFSAYKITQTVQTVEDGVTVTKEKTIGYYLDDCADITKLNTSEYNFPTGNSLAEDVASGVVKLNEFGGVVNLVYEIEDYDFANSDTKQLISELNNILGDWFTKIIRLDGVEWVSGSNDNLVTNIENIARYILKNYGERYLSQWITIPTDEEIDALTLETGIVRFGKEILEKFAGNIILPEDANSIRSIVTYALCELIADKDPSEDIYGQLIDGTMNANGDDGWKAVAAVVARYYLNSITNMNLPEDLSFEDTIEHIVNWALTNYGGILDYAADLSTDTTKTAWQKLDGVIFGLIPLEWLPTTARVLKDGVETEVTITGSEVLIMDILLGNILDCKFEYLFDLFDKRDGGPLDQSPIKVLLSTIENILNSIIPGLFPTGLETVEALLTKEKLGDLLKGLCTGLYEIRTNLIPAALPLVCMILELTTEQQLEDPTVTYPDFIYSTTRSLSGTEIVLRNSSTGVNTAWTDAAGVTHQDALYKVKVKSITTDNSKVTVTYNVNETLNGGETKSFPVTGALTADGLVTFTISYEILDESGKSLTSSPIDVRFYTYVSASHPDDDEQYYAYDSDGWPTQYVAPYGMNNHYVISAPTAYITSWGDLKDQSYTLGRDSTSEDNHGLTATISYVSYSATNANGDDVSSVLGVAPFANVTTDYNGYFGSFDLFNVSVPQVADPNNAANTVDDDITKYVGNYKADLTLHFTDTLGGAAVNYTISRNLVLFNDYGLPSLVNSAMDTNRQESNYATSGTYTYVEKTTDANGDVVETTYTADASTAWDTYLEALAAAQALVLAPKTVDTFSVTDNGYEAAAAALKRAAADLDACAVSAGVASLEALREQYQPSNPEGMEYDDPDYNYMGSEDYVLYTYERYADHRSNMDSLINSQKVEAPGENATAEELEAYQKALDAIPTLKLFDITYRGHMYEMNANRLVRRTASTNYLQHAYDLVYNQYLAMDEAEYSVGTWAALEKAIAFAETVLADTSSDLRQTKVNTARQELIAAYKGLASKNTDPADYAQLIDAIAQADAIFAIDNYEAKYTGIDALLEAYEAATAVEDGLLAEFQDVIDEAAQALLDALEALEAVAAGLDFTPAVDAYEALAGNTMAGVGYTWAPKANVFDSGASFIDGLVLDYYDAIDTILTTTGGAELEYTANDNTAGGLGTGDIVIVDGTEYTLVIYGDTDGTGTCDTTDVADIIMLANWELSAEEYEATSAAKLKAADIVADNCIDISDVSFAIQVASYNLYSYQITQDGTFSGTVLPQ